MPETSPPRRTVARLPRAFALGGLLVVVACLVLVVGERSHASGPAQPRRAEGAAALEAMSRSWAGRLRAAPARDAFARAVERAESRVPYVAVGGARRRDVALTFDDGPGPYTPRLTSERERLRAPATFFQVGTMVWAFRSTEQHMARDPRFAFGDHTESHAALGRLSAALQWAEIVDGAQAARTQGVRGVRLFRPPYGSFNATTLEIAHHLRLLPVLWTIDSEDYQRPGVARIVANVLGRARPGAIVLMHDAGGDRVQTIAALPVIVRALRRRGFDLVTVPRLLLEEPAPDDGAG